MEANPIQSCAEASFALFLDLEGLFDYNLPFFFWGQDSKKPAS